MDLFQGQSWDVGAKDYTAFARFTKLYCDDMAQDIAARLSPDARLLDMATGTGSAVIAIVERTGDVPISISATDVSPAMLELMKREVEKASCKVQVETKVADLCDHRCYPDSSFDAITCAFGVMFSADPIRTAAEILRLLRPGATAYILTWHFISNFAELEDIAIAQGSLEVYKNSKSLLGAFSKDEGSIRSVFRQGGFQPGNIDIQFLQHTGFLTVEEFVAMLDSNPVIVAKGPWNAEVAKQVLARKADGAGNIPLFGTAILTKVTR